MRTLFALLLTALVIGEACDPEREPCESPSMYEQLSEDLTEDQKLSLLQGGLRHGTEKEEALSIGENSSVAKSLRGSDSPGPAASLSVSLKDKIEMSGSDNEGGNGTLFEEEGERALLRHKNLLEEGEKKYDCPAQATGCLFKKYWYNGCVSGDEYIDEGRSDDKFCEEGSKGWAGGKSADYCYETGSKYCHKGYKCCGKHWGNHDRNCCPSS